MFEILLNDVLVLCRWAEPAGRTDGRWWNNVECRDN